MNSARISPTPTQCDRVACVLIDSARVCAHLAPETADDYPAVAAMLRAWAKRHRRLSPESPQGRIAKLHSLPFMSGCCALGRRGRGRSRRACAKRGSPPKRPVSVLAISSMQRTARSGRWPRANSLHRHASGTGGGTAPLCHLYYMNNRSYRTVSVPYVAPGTTPSWAHLLGRGKAAKPRATAPRRQRLPPCRRKRPLQSHPRSCKR